MTESPSSSESDSSADLLLIEDNPGDTRLLEEALSDLQSAHALHTVTTGDNALDFVHQRGDYTDAPQPDLIFLDWNLPRTSGEEILAQVKEDPHLAQIPVIVLTGSTADKSICTAYANHANACIRKGTDPETFLTTIRAVEDFWLSVAELPAPTES
ncbi:response regulator [Natrinema sp. 1APR25-10V2]|uniref:response regulator n=1 Tax=Natrinema sp. 1APR25-10V2 TaxID=2951081 RepID=UPI00287519DE|nr:response regulator [Natrinema sp. 1APR25-10V2]MDS0474669.1 response regulator [Natrinema sp. 1APR25-10V2]